MDWYQIAFVLTVVGTIWSGIYSCENGDVRLVDGFNNRSGRVEFCHDGEWGTVCDDDFKNVDAKVVCRQLGLKTAEASYLSSFGGGNGSIILDNVECTGEEERLENCTHNGIGHHDCHNDHSEDAGVFCDLNESNCTLEAVPHSDVLFQIVKPVSRTCLQRYGNCVPFRAREEESICDDLYISGVDYIYVPQSRYHGRYSQLMADTIFFGPLLLAGLDKCYDVARRMICHFYFPPCGNSTVFELPTSVCKDTCRAVESICGEEWDNVVKMFEQNRVVLELVGQTFIDCDDPGHHLNPIPYKCTDLGITYVPKDTNTTQPSDSSNNNLGLVFSVLTPIVALLITIMTVLSIIISRVFIKKRQKQQLTVSNPITARERTSHKDKISISHPIPPRRLQIFQATSPNHYLDDNALQPPKPKIPRVRSGYIRQLTEERLLISKESIKLIGIVGQGEFGIVYKATLDGCQGNCSEIVAVKTLKAFGDGELNKLVEESLVMAKFSHLNVMKLIGVCPYIRDSLYIVMPYMAHGSLLSYLRKHRADLTIVSEDNAELVREVCEKLLSMCLQIAKGMTYLASLKFVHRDLAARNCMIDENFVIKVSDFGLTEDIYARNYFRQVHGGDEEPPVKLPVRWMAIESLNDGVFSEKSDVWSFGVTCWEVFSLGKMPYPGIDPFSLARRLERGERLEKPINEACSESIYSIIKSCWYDQSERRPTFSELVAIISATLEEMAGYLDLTSRSLSTELFLSSGNYDTLQRTDSAPRSI